MISRQKNSEASLVLAMLVACAGVAGAALSARGQEASPENVPWRKKLESWRAKLNLQKEWTPEMKDIMAEIAALEDPAAVRPVVALMAREKDRAMKLVYLRALGSIGRGSKLQSGTAESKELLATLVKYSVEEEAARDTDPLRDEAIRQIRQLPNLQDAVPLYIRYLSGKFASRAAEALSATKLATKANTSDLPDPKLTKALIDALVEKRVKEVAVPGWMERAGMGGGLTGRAYWYRGRGGVWMMKVPEYVPNASVYKTLVEYTGVDHQFEQSQWRKWYESYQPNDK